MSIKIPLQINPEYSPATSWTMGTRGRDLVAHYKHLSRSRDQLRSGNSGEELLAHKYLQPQGSQMERFGEVLAMRISGKMLLVGGSDDTT